MTKFELEALHMENCIRARELIGPKGESYSYGTDPFKNFRRYGLKGILVRMNDKFERLDSMVESGKINDKVCRESADDAILDIINYANLFAALRKEMAGEAAPKPTPTEEDLEAYRHSGLQAIR